MRVEPRAGKSGIGPKGFTVIELIVAIAVLGVLLALAVPSFITTMRDSRRTTLVNEILISLQSARAEAYKQSRDTYVCPSTDGGATCSTTASAWGSGWIVWVDNNRNGTFNSPDELIRYQANDSTGVTATTNADNARFQYRPFQVSRTSAVANELAVAICDPRGGSDATQNRSVIVDAMGRPRIAKGDTTGLCP